MTCQRGRGRQRPTRSKAQSCVCVCVTAFPEMLQEKKVWWSLAIFSFYSVQNENGFLLVCRVFSLSEHFGNFNLNLMDYITCCELRRVYGPLEAIERNSCSHKGKSSPVCLNSRQADILKILNIHTIRSNVSKGIRTHAWMIHNNKHIFYTIIRTLRFVTPVGFYVVVIWATFSCICVCRELSWLQGDCFKFAILTIIINMYVTDMKTILKVTLFRGFLKCGFKPHYLDYSLYLHCGKEAWIISGFSSFRV